MALNSASGDYGARASNSTQYGGAVQTHCAASPGNFFTGAKQFVISGGEFTSVTNLITNAVPEADFRTIQLGNLDLRHEIRLDHRSGMAHRLSPSNCVRRIYAARIDGVPAGMTAIVYEGSTAQKEWRQDVTKYHGLRWVSPIVPTTLPSTELRHPNVVQVYGTVSSGCLRATVFYGDLIPIQDFFRIYHDSAISTAYLHGYFDAATYIRSVSRARLTLASYTPWIRLSTGILCIELTSCNTKLHLYPYAVSENACFAPITQLGPHIESTITFTLSLHHYHEICYWSLSRVCDYRLSSGSVIRLGGILTSLESSGGQDPVEIAYLPSIDIMDSGWRGETAAAGRGSPLEELVMLENGWSRTLSLGQGAGCSTCCWLAQANNVFHRAQITSDYSEVVLVSSIYYEIEITGDQLSGGYIFLCPVTHLGTGRPSQFRHPKTLAYWSADPSGCREFNLSANSSGIPVLNVKTEFWGWSWDQSVYTGLWKFHEGKGFNPESQDVAIDLGLPLYHLSAQSVWVGTRSFC
ncbi:hypothetical protein DFH08DRAFT_821022 [Mycena albidolilacea]|uniref:Uncharacterized protein n=1 Tax=Mycena albidolilacea TaxID=1033008 RepID=A0AAD6ZBL0_9AGAR|nr:hypothetical protein DFH08DRAFT_821022 [Mycena albidolilacea]